MTAIKAAVRVDSPWWQRGVVYHVYPRSFMDSDGDGIGDLAGAIERLDHLVALGVDALWLSPIFRSPMADFGYDVADYEAVDPVFGTLADFDRLVTAVHARGLKLVLDFVPNHTSDEHPWFVASRASRESAQRDWYIWRDPAPGGGVPNNWLSRFGGSAWTFDARTGQYYLHSFLDRQPDLNWRNPAVRHAMYDVLRFWLDRGVDGFRVDVIWLLIKDDRFRDNPIDPAYRSGGDPFGRLRPVYDSDRPEVHTIVAEMRAVLDAYDDRVLIGEIYLPVERLVTYYGANLSGAQLPFNFALIDAAWNAASIAEIVRAYEAALPPGAWPNWVLGNHDKPRIATRIGPAQARIAALLLLTLRGTPTLYYGDELGMTDVAIDRARVRDPAERNQPGRGLGRDPQRSPMLWDAGSGGGFSTGTPWLPLGDRHVRDVATQRQDPDSMLNLYARALHVRRASAALTFGSIENVRADGAVLRYERCSGDERVCIALNLSSRRQIVEQSAARIVLSTHTDRPEEHAGHTLTLRPAEGVILLVPAGPSHEP